MIPYAYNAKYELGNVRNVDLLSLFSLLQVHYYSIILSFIFFSVFYVVDDCLVIGLTALTIQ